MFLSSVSAVQLNSWASSYALNATVEQHSDKFGPNKTNTLIDLVDQATLDPEKTDVIIAMIQELIEHTRKNYDAIEGRLVDAEKAVTDATTDRDKKRDHLVVETQRLTQELEIAEAYLSEKTGARNTEKGSGSIERNGVDLEISMLQRIIEMLNNMIAWTRCPNGWQNFGRSCYFLGERKNNHISAREECQGRGGDLIRWDSDNDETAMKSMCGGGCILGIFLCHQDPQKLCYEDDTIFDHSIVTVHNWHDWQRTYAGYSAGEIHLLNTGDNWFTLCEKQLEANT